MTKKENSLSQITRSIMVGASAGTIALVQVGCADLESFIAQQATSAGEASNQSTSNDRSVVNTESAACQRAQKTKSVADVNALMTQYPRSRCIAPILNALPPQTLAALSPSAVSGLSSSATRNLSARTRSQLPAAVASGTPSQSRGAASGLGSTY